MVAVVCRACTAYSYSRLLKTDAERNLSVSHQARLNCPSSQRDSPHKSYCWLKIAPTGSLLLITTEHVRFGAVLGMQFADQPPNVEPAAGVAVSVAVEFRTKLPVQPALDGAFVVHLIAPVVSVTVPLPRPTS